MSVCQEACDSGYPTRTEAVVPEFFNSERQSHNLTLLVHLYSCHTVGERSAAECFALADVCQQVLFGALCYSVAPVIGACYHKWVNRNLAGQTTCDSL